MHAGKRLRMLALAFAVPVAAIGSLAFSTHVGPSSAAAVVNAAAPDNTTHTATKLSNRAASSTKPTSPTANPSATVATNGPSRSATTSASPGRSGGPGATAVNCVISRGSTPVSFKTARVSGHQVLVDAGGCALYVNTKDTAHASTCGASCEATWIPVRGPAQAGTDVNQTDLATFTRSNGRAQATFFGQQLYYFAKDTRPGQASGLGVDSRFFLIDQNGKPVTN
jgi:predicted lipoprotein with Yx(FWY)xxD motif